MSYHFFYMILNLLKDTLLFGCCSLIPLPSLFNVFGDIFLLQLSHALNFVKIDDKAGIITVVKSDAFATEDSEVIAAVEMLDSLRMFLAEFFLEGVLILVCTCTASLLEVEVCLGEDRVFFDYFVQNVDV